MKKPTITKPTLALILTGALVATVFAGVQISNLLEGDFTVSEKIELSWDLPLEGENFIRDEIYQYGVNIKNPGSATYTALLKLEITCSTTLPEGCLTIKHDQTGSMTPIVFTNWDTTTINGDIGSAFTVNPKAELTRGLEITIDTSAPLASYTVNIWAIAA